MDNFGQQLTDQAKQVAEAVTIEPLKGIAKAVTGPLTGVSDQPADSSGKPSPEQIAQKDAQMLAVARRNLAEFNARLQQTYQQSRQVEEEKKQQEEQVKQQEEMQDKSEKKRAQEEAMRQAQRSGGTEGSREAK